MEIKDYLRAVRNRLWLPVLVPVVAAGATVGVLYKQPQQYSATATVIVPALSAKGYSTSAVTQYFSTFKDVVSSSPLADQVAKETGAKAAEVQKCVAATLSASSNIIELTCASTNKDIVVPMAQTAAVDALDSLLLPAQAQAQNGVNTAQQQLDAANKQLAQFTQQTGSLLPVDDYRLQQGEISSLLTQYQQALLAGDSARAGGLKTIIDQRQQKLTTLANQVSGFQQLSDSKSSALAVLNKADESLLTVKSEIASDHAAGSVVTKDNGREARVSSIAKFGAIAYAVALLLCLAVIALLEFMRPTRLAPAALRGGSKPGTTAGNANATTLVKASAGKGTINGNGSPGAALTQSGEGRSKDPATH